MNAINLTLTPLRKAVAAGGDRDVHVLARIRAPERPQESGKRPRLNLGIVIDRSGSMSGRPLREALRCARFIVDNLRADDRASLVVYDQTVEVLVPNGRVGDGTPFRQALEGVVSRGTTALFDGWLAGAEQVAAGIADADISRVLLLSDGQANVGVTDPHEIAHRCADLAEVGVTTSTYGLGHHFNEELMGAMAEAGLGNAYYGESSDDLLDPFREEFDLLTALCARRLALHLHTPPGVTAEVLNRYRRDRRGYWMLPDLADGGEVWALIRLRVPAALADSGRLTETGLLTASLEFADVEGVSAMVGPARLTLEAVSEVEWVNLPEDADVRSRIQEVRAADLQDEARLAARRRDWELVDQILGVAEAEAADNPWVAGSIKVLQRYAGARDTERLSKEAYYSSTRSRRRQVDPRDPSARYDLDAERAKRSYLRRKREQGKSLD